MREHAAKLKNELIKAEETLSKHELDSVNYNFLTGALTTFLELSDDGRISVDELISAYKMAVTIKMKRRDEVLQKLNDYSQEK